VGVLCLIGIAIIHGVTATRHKDPRPSTVAASLLMPDRPKCPATDAPDSAYTKPRFLRHSGRRFLNLIRACTGPSARRIGASPTSSRRSVPGPRARLIQAGARLPAVRLLWKPSDFKRIPRFRCRAARLLAPDVLDDLLPQAPSLLVAVASGLAACSAHRQIARSCHCARPLSPVWPSASVGTPSSFMRVAGVSSTF
jgi:hypothetical protein